MQSRHLQIFAAAMLCVAVAGCGKSDDSKSQDNSAPANSSGSADSAPAPAPPSPDELAQQQRPADQVNLENLLRKVNDAQTTTGNGILDQENFTKAYNAYCSKMQEDGPHKDWTANVRDIYPPDSSTGKPAIHLVTPGGLEVHQDIDPQSALYATVRGLKEGDYVKFSIDVNHIQEDAPGILYQECDRQTYSDGSGPHLNVFLGGNLTALSPLH